MTGDKTDGSLVEALKGLKRYDAKVSTTGLNDVRAVMRQATDGRWVSWSDVETLLRSRGGPPHEEETKEIQIGEFFAREVESATAPTIHLTAEQQPAGVTDAERAE